MDDLRRIAHLLGRSKAPLITWDDRMYHMQQLGEVYLYMAEPFQWRIRHDGVFIALGDDDLIPEGRGINPYSVCDDHWGQLTRPGVILRSWTTNRIVMWSGEHWVDAQELLMAS